MKLSEIIANLELDPNQYRLLLKPILSGQANGVYGFQFLSPVPIKNQVALNNLEPLRQ